MKKLLLFLLIILQSSQMYAQVYDTIPFYSTTMTFTSAQSHTTPSTIIDSTYYMEITGKYYVASPGGKKDAAWYFCYYQCATAGNCNYNTPCPTLDSTNWNAEITSLRPLSTSYSSTNYYEYVFTGDGNPVSFTFVDNGGYGDNGGQLQISIYKLVNVCQDSIQSEPISSSFQTVPGTAHFTTSHSDTSATYQWQQNNGTGWTDLSDFGIYSGTLTDSLVLTGITTALNGYGYRCIIDACTMDTTDVAYLTVVDNVGIEESSKDLIVSPNPTSGLISINLTRTTMYNVYNMNGQKVAEGKTEGQIDLSNLPSGSYQLLLFTQDGKKTISLQKL